MTGEWMYKDTMPHCDPRILHKPGDCEICDHYPDLQEARVRMMINFTGEAQENYGPCPADFLRGASHHEWAGNRPMRSGKGK